MIKSTLSINGTQTDNIEIYLSNFQVNSLLSIYSSLSIVNISEPGTYTHLRYTANELLSSYPYKD